MNRIFRAEIHSGDIFANELLLFKPFAVGCTYGGDNFARKSLMFGKNNDSVITIRALVHFQGLAHFHVDVSRRPGERALPRAAPRLRCHIHHRPQTEPRARCVGTYAAETRTRSDRPADAVVIARVHELQIQRPRVNFNGLRGVA